ncbi:hypothetical protein, partial [Pseudomonas viridiflava]|uniref:hypothetical protein n=1 Tax=Pseudomonas viridiflava TaxID=33069 RepID=UPI001BAF93D8
VWLDDIASREKTLSLTRLRLNTGLASSVDEARILTGLAVRAPAWRPRSINVPVRSMRWWR